MSKERQGGQERHSQSKPNQPEQSPRGGGINKPELHPPKERPLPFEPNLPKHKPKTGELDPKTERHLRAYAEFEAEGDPKKAERLFKRYRKIPDLIEFFKNGTTGLAYGPHPMDLRPEED